MGSKFWRRFSKEAVAGSGLAMVANIKTLDTGMIGAIVIASLAVYLHGKLFDVNLPDYLGLFKGSSLVVVAGFVLMLPVAYLFCLIWPQFQAGIASLQYFLTSAGVFGVWLYTFLERILIPTGLHHFIYIHLFLVQPLLMAVYRLIGFNIFKNLLNLQNLLLSYSLKVDLHFMV